MVIQGVLSTGIPIHLIPILVERGFTLDAAVAAYAVIGPAQVAARFLVGLAERAFGMRAVGVLTFALGVLAQALPPSFRRVLARPVRRIYGASNGLMTILRALLPAELFGREDYGTILGMIAAPANFARALGPFIFGALAAARGSPPVIALVNGSLPAKNRFPSSRDALVLPVWTSGAIEERRISDDRFSIS